jgi:hypothetical protein
MRVCACGVGFSVEGIPLAFALLQTLVAPDSRWRRGVADVLSRRTSQWSYAGEWYAVGVRLDDPTHGVEMAGELDVPGRSSPCVHVARSGASVRRSGERDVHGLLRLRRFGPRSNCG